MSALANFMARIIWRAVLWLMRRNWMKAIQRNTIRMVPERFRAKAAAGQNRQNRFARRIGLPMLKVMMNLVLGSIIITVTFLLATHLYDAGILTMPWQMQKALRDTQP